MLRCGYCEVICECYEDWLSHIVSEGHQAKLGMSEVFSSHKDKDRNERTIFMSQMNPKTHPYDVVCHFANAEPLAFITDAFVHLFNNVNDKFYLIVFDQKKFVDRICTIHERCGDQNVAGSLVHCQSKSNLSEKEWKSKIESSFFYRRHEHLKKMLAELVWEEQIKQFLSIVSLDGEGYQQREKIMDELEGLIREDFENATVNPFGSCTTWLADINADLDVYVDALGNGGRNDMTLDQKMEIMKKVEKLLRKKYDRRNVFTIKNTRVPIIQLSHPSGLKVDLSFENCMSVQNSKMIRLMTKLDYRVRPLLIFLRYWARYHNMIGPQSVKSYALMLMTLVFLKKKNILPTVNEVQNVEGTRPFMVCSWNATFCCSRECIQRAFPKLKCVRDAPSTDRNAQEIMQLAYGFFTEYSTFDFDTQVICPLIGDHLPKDSFDSMHGKDLPAEMGLLKANLVTGQCRSFPTQKPLCVQDPFSLNINVTSSCNSPDLVQKFKTACAMAAEALKPFATVYDSADTESILELCCQQVTVMKQQEVMKMNSATAEDHDNMAYVKTEATTTTKEDEDWDAFLPPGEPGSKTTADSNTPTDALQSIKSFYADNFDSKDQQHRSDSSSASHDSWSSDNNRRRDRDRGGPVKIQRISMYDDSEESEIPSPGTGTNSYDFYCGYTVPDSPEHSSGEIAVAKDKNEPSTSKKTVKSVVVVANKVERRSNSNSPKSSTSSPPKASKKKDKTSPEKSAKEPVVKFIPSSEPPPGLSFLSSQALPVSSSSLGSTSTGTSGAGHKAKEGTDNSFTPDQAVEYITGIVAPVQQISPAEVNPMFDNNYGYAIQPKKSPFASSTPKAVSQVKAKAEVKKQKVERIVQIVSIKNQTESKNEVEKKTRTSPSAPSASTIPSLKPNRSTLSREAAASAASRMELYFPAFAIYLSEDFYQSFNTAIRSLTEYVQSKRLSAMKIFWMNTVLDIFEESRFWQRIRPISANGSFSRVKLDEDKASLIFEEVNRVQEDFWSQSETAYAPNRKRYLASDTQPEEDQDQSTNDDNEQGPFTKLQKTSSTTGLPLKHASESSPETQQSKSYVLSMLLKIPSNIRKKHSYAYFLRCHPTIMALLKVQWVSMYCQMRVEYPRTTPLDMLGNICEQIKLTLSNLPPAHEWIDVKMLVAFDTSGDPPGLYFGFEYEHREDDPNYDKQTGMHETLELILRDLIDSQATHKIIKYFKR